MKKPANAGCKGVLDVPKIIVRYGTVCYSSVGRISIHNITAIVVSVITSFQDTPYVLWIEGR